MAAINKKEKSPKKKSVSKLKETSKPKSSDIDVKAEIYDFLKWVKFVVNYCNFFTNKDNGIENVWISLLMISFGTTSAMDKVIWIIPMFLCLLLRPYAYNFVARSSFCKIYIKTKIITYLSLLSILGAICVIVSSKIHETHFVINSLIQLKRILVCTIGWTIIGISLGLTSYLVDELKLTLEHDTHVMEHVLKKNVTELAPKKEFKLKRSINSYLKEYSHYPVLGETFAYVTSIIICLIFQGDSFEHFYKLCNLMYAACAISYVFIFFYLLKKLSKFAEKVDNNPLNREGIIKLRHSVQELKKSNIKERIYLVIHFIICFMVDAIVILGTYWVAAINETDFNLGKSYCYGVKVGSLYLIIFMVVSNLKLPKTKHWGLENTLNFMKKYSIFYLVVAIICFITFEEITIFAFILSGAVLVSLYNSKVHTEQMKEQRFRACVEIVEKSEKVFRISMFPLLIGIVFGAHAYPTWINIFFLSGTLIGILFFIVDVKKHSFVEKEKEKNT